MERKKNMKKLKYSQHRVLLHLWAGFVLLMACQTARSLCSKENMKEGKSGYVCLYNCTQGKTKKTTEQHWNDYQDVHYEYIRQKSGVNGHHFLSTCSVNYIFIHISRCISNLEFHFSIGLLRAELHLFLELLQSHICLLDLLPLALPGSVQLALQLPLNQTHTQKCICKVTDI